MKRAILIFYCFLTGLFSYGKNKSVLPVFNADRQLTAVTTSNCQSTPSLLNSIVVLQQKTLENKLVGLSQKQIGFGSIVFNNQFPSEEEYFFAALNIQSNKNR